MRRRPLLSESLYARLGHDTFMTLFDHVGAPVAPAIRYAGPADPAPDRSSDRRSCRG